MLWLVVAKERDYKQRVVAEALRHGFLKHNIACQICVDDPPVPTDPFIAMGQLWVVERIVPKAIKTGQPFWVIDNGYYLTSGQGNQKSGHYEITYRGLAPILLSEERASVNRFPPETVLKPWKENDPKKVVMIAIPGPSYGRCIGMDMVEWTNHIESRVQEVTDRQIIVRSKATPESLEDQLKRTHVVVTHSSNVAVDAVWRGIPAIVEDQCPAAPVCSRFLEDIENPWKPDRAHWWRSLMSQQYTINEMKNGTAWGLMKRVQEQVDGGPLPRNWFRQ